MKNIFRLAVLGLFPLVANAAKPWHEITMPTVNEAAAAFPQPPKDYRAIHWAIWGGQQTKDRILADIEALNANGAGTYMINNSRGLLPKYFTPEYLDLVKFVVTECKKRGMKVWIEDEAGYPDGFAGGMISRDHPEMGMQGIVADLRYTLGPGETLSIPLPVDTLGIFATPRGATAPATTQPDPTAPTNIPLPADGKFKWTGPSGSTWEVTIQAATTPARYSVVAGQTLSIPLPPDTRSIQAAPRTGARGARGGGGGAPQAPTIIAVPADGQFKWTAPPTGSWEITFVRHVYRSSPTRFVNREDGTSDKDSLYSIIDYLDPQATALYMKLIHDTYEKAVGDEFGKTIMGFRGDEADYTGFAPWTPKLLEIFQKQKGYDLQPYIAQFFVSPPTPEGLRAKADYWDVWSALFRDNFFKPQEEWCRARNMEYMNHLNHEEVMLSRGEGMITNEGSFFRAIRYAGVPGIDNLNQISPGIVADFPKLAGSAAHLFGAPMAWTEEGGSTGQSGKFVIDYQLVRGINSLNIRGLNRATTPDAKNLFDSAAATSWYTGRAGYLLAIGRPAAQVALYHPTDSMWLNDTESDAVTMKLVTELMEQQIDFDHIDQDSLASICTLENGGLKNLSGQIYRAVIIPTSTVIQKNVLQRLRDFAAAGGKVIFVGRTPSMVIDKSFLHPDPAPDLSFATLEPTPDITPAVVAALPKPDVKLDAPCAPLKYIHRSLKDGELYFFFNESTQTQTRTATLSGSGSVQLWDPSTGTIHPLPNITPAAIPLTLASQESRFFIIGPVPSTVGQPALAGNQTLVALDGNWSITLGDKQMDSPLKTWHDLGEDNFAGIATYQKSFDTPILAPNQRIYLDLGAVHEAARVRINGKVFDSRGWTPYVWEVTDTVKTGANTLEVQVQMPSAGGGGFGGGRAARGGNATTGPATTAPAGGGRRGRGANQPLAPGGPPAALGLLGPVRLIAQ